MPAATFAGQRSVAPISRAACSRSAGSPCVGPTASCPGAAARTFAFCDLEAAEIAKCNLATVQLRALRPLRLQCRGYELSRRAVPAIDPSPGRLSRRSILTKASFDTLQHQLCRSVRTVPAELRVPVVQVLGDVVHRYRPQPKRRLLGCSLDRVEWERARLTKADLRGVRSRRALIWRCSPTMRGVRISASEQVGDSPRSLASTCTRPMENNRSITTFPWNP